MRFQEPSSPTSSVLDAPGHISQIPYHQKSHDLNFPITVPLACDQMWLDSADHFSDVLTVTPVHILSVFRCVQRVNYQMNVRRREKNSLRWGRQPSCTHINMKCQRIVFLQLLLWKLKYYLSQ